jgi:hypothetical protein
LKVCRDCGSEKEMNNFPTYTSGKYRPICNECLYKMQQNAWDKRPVEKKLWQLANGILARTDVNSTVRKNSYYRENGITCEIGNKSKDVYKYLYEHHYDDVALLLENNQKPSIDRIDSSKGYEPGNIRVITLEENIKMALINAHEKLSKRVLVSYFAGESYEFSSVREAARSIGVGRNTLNAMLKGKSLKGKNFTISEIKGV